MQNYYISIQLLKIVKDQTFHIIEGEDISDYLHNIRLIARRGVIESRDCGLAASIIPAYQRHIDDVRIRANPPKESEFVGNVGDKIVVKVIVNKDCFKEIFCNCQRSKIYC